MISSPAPDVITVTPNPALDLTYALAGIRLGASHRVATPSPRAGGKGVNVARVAHSQGCRVLTLAPVGGRTGQEFTAELKAAGIPSDLVVSPAPTRRSIAVVDTGPGGDATLFNEAGHAQPGAVLEALIDRAVRAARIRAAETGAAAVIVGAGSLPESAGEGFYPRLARAAADAGAMCVLDTSGPALLEAAASGAAYLKPNEHELREATGAATIVEGVEMLGRLGACRILVSRGPDGLSLFDSARPGVAWTGRLPVVLEGNPTGAGDAAVAALATAAAEGVEDPEEILRRAVAWSAAAVLMPLAGEISSRHASLAEIVTISKEYA